ncbi:MAG: DoxX family protein [Bacteroidetes bacterium]|jgi:putative oxidoreductase|nr:DoxX family protein [Bacteroidota bacterium]
MFDKWSSYAPLPLRLILGFGFLFHGVFKFGSGHDGFVGMLTGIGVPAPGLMAYVVGLVETLGGLALIVGAFVALVSLPLIINMLVAIFTVHLPAGFNFMNMTGMGPDGPQFGMPGYEVPLLYAAGLATLALMGAGALSVDEMRKGKSAGGDT